MSEETTWIDKAFTVLATGGVLAFLQWFFSGRKKEGSESSKIKSETREVDLKTELLEAEYYKKALTEVRQINEELMKTVKAQQLRIEELERNAIVRERRLTQLELLHNNTNKLK